MGELVGAADSPRQVRYITLQVEQGVLRVSQPSFGWVGGLARTPQELARLVTAGFREAQVNAHSVWRGVGYDGKTQQRRRPARRGSRTDVHDPREWRVDSDGMWIAPGNGRNRRWRVDSQVVQRVKARRAAMGLPAIPGPVPQSSASA